MKPSPIAACGLGLALLSCQNAALRRCLDADQAQQWQVSAVRCKAAFQSTHDPRAGAAAARAAYALGHPDAVLAWAERLPREPGIASLAAAVYQQRGENGKAEAAYRRDLALYRQRGDAGGEADTLHRLFYLAWQASRYGEALQLATRAKAATTRSGDPERQRLAGEALSGLLYAVGDLAGARRALEQSWKLLRADDTPGQARFLANRGNLYLEEGRWALARRDLEAALERAAGQGERQFFRSVHLNLVKAALEQNDLPAAREHLDAAWKAAEPAGPPATSLRFYRARLALARNDASEALAQLQAGLAEDPAPDWAWDLEYQLGRAEELRGEPKAAEAAYRRSIALVESLRQSLGFEDFEAALLERKRQPFEALFRLQAESGRAAAALDTAERVSSSAFLDALATTAAADQRIQSFEALLPAMSASPLASRRSFASTLAALGDRRAWSYFQSGDRMWLMVTRKTGARAFPLAATVAELRDLVSRFLAAPDDRGTAGQLGEVLLPPAARPLPGETLHLVTDGPLGNLPFAALRLGERYLVEEHALVLIPSLGTLAVLESLPRGGDRPAAVFADSRGDLPAARAEAAEVARQLGGWERSGSTASWDELRRASGSRVLHFALHTGLGPRGPWLRLADREVAAGELVAGRIGAPLVVLASCASAARPGRPLWGSLSAAFLASGSRSVLATLGSVEDAAARELVLRFYGEGGEREPAAALARAQRVAIRQGRSPKEWAPFVLVGSSRPHGGPSAPRRK